jgi:hypothetical protein
MLLKEFVVLLQDCSVLQFLLPDGSLVPAHFHITEIALLKKSFIDCGGVYRDESSVTMQVRVAGDTQHRLSSEKLLSIIALSRSFIADDLPVQIEYQGETIGRYGLDRNGTSFLLVPLFTNCLAQDKCGISVELLPKQAKQCCG